MLDENLPTFVSRQSSDNPLLSVVFFSHNGSEPTPEYAFKKPDPALPLSRNKFAMAIGDAHSPDVIFAEVLIKPEWQQPTLSAAEIRAQNGVPPTPVPMIPDNFSIMLYNPDQTVSVKGEKSTWTGKESWEFEMPQQSFRVPSSSKLDQENNPASSELAPKILFRWKRDSKFSKDMTCYMCGKSIGGNRSKEPDITVAFYKQGREPAVTIYEPNLQRVEVEDRKGLEVALLLGAEVIREIYLFPNRDSFNIHSVPPAKIRKNSRPIPFSSSPAPAHPQSRPKEPNAANGYSMSGGLNISGALGKIPPAHTASPVAQQSIVPQVSRKQAEIDAETMRLQQMVEQEERERERRDLEEQKRIKKMLEQEEKERKKRDADVAKETERLREEFGMQGQSYGASNPALPPRPNGAGPSNFHPPPPQSQLHPPDVLNGFGPTPRPVSAGPQNGGGLFSGLWHGPGQGYKQGPQHRPGRRRGGSPDGGKNIKPKRSVFF